METRKERFRKLREDIKSMPEGGYAAPSFSADPIPARQEPFASSAPLPQEETAPTSEPAPTPKGMPERRSNGALPSSEGPYAGYAANRRRAFLTKVIISGVIVIGFVVWMITLIVRSK